MDFLEGEGCGTAGEEGKGDLVVNFFQKSDGEGYSLGSCCSLGVFGGEGVFGGFQVSMCVCVGV